MDDRDRHISRQAPGGPVDPSTIGHAAYEVCTPPRSSARSAAVPRASCSRRRSPFLAWYLLYVVMSMWATDFMGTKVVGNINVALVFGLLQFVTTFVLAWLYARFANRELDPLARDPREALRERRMRPMSSADPHHHPVPRGRRCSPSAITFWASRQTSRRRRLLRRRPVVQRLPERPGHLRRLHVRRVVPRHLRRHRARPATTASSTPSASWSPGWSRCCSSPSCCATPAATRWPTSSPTG